MFTLDIHNPIWYCFFHCVQIHLLRYFGAALFGNKLSFKAFFWAGSLRHLLILMVIFWLQFPGGRKEESLVIFIKYYQRLLLLLQNYFDIPNIFQGRKNTTIGCFVAASAISIRLLTKILKFLFFVTDFTFTSPPFSVSASFLSNCIFCPFA